MRYERKSLKFARIILIILALLIYIPTGLFTYYSFAIGLHYSGFPVLIQMLIACLIIFILTMPPLIYLFGVRFTSKIFQYPSKIFVLPVIIIFQAIIFLSVFELLKPPYALIADSPILDGHNTKIVLTFVFGLIAILIASIAFGGLFMYNKCVLYFNKIHQN